MAMTLDRQFQQYFQALDRAGNEDRCFLCRRTPAEVKAFFGFHEDGTPIDADKYGIEDVVIDPELDIMSYKASRPVCAVCQLNLDSILLTDDGRELLRKLLWQLEHERDRLWSREE
jgi:PP-loop superfamily ATP-utilizing enzyme